jgi:hypothetical protein
MKLSYYGIEIYAAIDGYSRYVPWFYCGVSETTRVSVLKQYLEVLSVHKKQLQYLRSDYGGETMMAANAHWQLRQQQQLGIKFDKCYWYGTSTANQRIEAWWA